jgi:hypothetical protein
MTTDSENTQQLLVAQWSNPRLIILRLRDQVQPLPLVLGYDNEHKQSDDRIEQPRQLACVYTEPSTAKQAAMFPYPFHK